MPTSTKKQINRIAKYMHEQDNGGRARLAAAIYTEYGRLRSAVVKWFERAIADGCVLDSWEAVWTQLQTDAPLKRETDDDKRRYNSVYVTLKRIWQADQTPAEREKPKRVPPVQRIVARAEKLSVGEIDELIRALQDILRERMEATLDRRKPGRRNEEAVAA